MVPWRKELQNLCDEKNVNPSCLYNSDQTGLFYWKLPYSLYVAKDHRKEYSGTKQMKDKNQVTAMICTAADGWEAPIALIGKSQAPCCVKLISNTMKTSPFTYRYQKNAWFDVDTIVWWIKNSVFWPEHLKKMDM